VEELTFDKKTHRYKLAGVVIPSVTQIIREAGLTNLDWIDKELLEAKADLGKKTHSATELYDKGTLDIEKLHPILKAYLNSWIKFRTDYNFIPTEIELQLFHSPYRYAGRIDRVGLLDKDLAIVEIKSGTIQKTNAIQTAGYSELYNYNKKKSKQIKRRMAVYLSPDNYKIEEHKNRDDISVFYASLTIYNFKRGAK